MEVDSYKQAKVRKQGSRVITHFSYNDKAMVERIDFVEEIKRKECYPKYREGSSWKYGGNECFGLFNARYITNGTVIFAEGEKTADLITQVTNFLCLSPPAFGWNENYISSKLINPKISGVIYLPDNDSAGEKKAKIVQKSCWMVGIPCLVFKYKGEMNEGDDFVDLHNRGEDIRKILSEIRELWN